MVFNPEDHNEEKEFLGKNKKSMKFVRGENAVDTRLEQAIDTDTLHEFISPENGGAQFEEGKQTKDDYEAKKKQFEEREVLVKREIEKQYAKYFHENDEKEKPEAVAEEDTNETTLPGRESIASRYRGVSRNKVLFRTRERHSRPNGTKSNNNGKDNFKTLPASLKIKSWKDKIRNFFHFQGPHTDIDPWEVHEDQLEEQDKQREKNIETLMKGFKE